jgi:hypothetical protein
MRHYLSFCYCLLALCSIIASQAGAQADSPSTKTFVHYYLEERDRAWSLRFTGTVPAQPGATQSGVYVVVLTPMVSGRGKIESERGGVPLEVSGQTEKYVSRVPVPPGTYTAEKPFVVTVPEDGWKGYYELLIFGNADPEFLNPRCDCL